MVTKYLENIFLLETKAWIVQHKVPSQCNKQRCAFFKGFSVFPDCQLLPDSACSGKTKQFSSAQLVLQAGSILPFYAVGLQKWSSQIWPHVLNMVDSPLKDRCYGAASSAIIAQLH